MNRFITSLIILTAFVISGTIALEAKGTKAEAQAMVKKAIAFYQANGQEKTFKEINNKSGQFTKEDLYVIVYDMTGVCVAHGFNLKQIGKNLMNVKDSDGVYYIKERVQIANTKGSGWQDYKFTNPVTFKVEDKTVYVEKFGNYIFGCGAYK